MIWYNGDMKVFHASHEIVEFPEVRKGRFAKDFSWGFYCTKLKAQAKRWANRGEGEPIINVYDDYTENPTLKILRFETMTEAWLDFVAHCRAGGTHDYDIVEGPMADDSIWNYVNDFIRGSLTRKQFWALAEFSSPTHQLSFHTLRALDCLKFQESEVCHDHGTAE